MGTWHWLKAEGIGHDLDHRLRKLYRTYPHVSEVRKYGSVTEALGTGKLARPGNATHDNDDEWYTPPEVVEAARQALGGIDLDPASCDVAQETVRAAQYYTKADDGLSRPWAGRVFLNPPFSVKAGKAEFVAKLVGHYVSGDVTAAVLVTSVDFGGAWAAPLRKHVAATCLGQGRTKFHHPEKSNDPALPSAFHYFGPDVARFAEAFEPLGLVEYSATGSGLAHRRLTLEQVERKRLALADEVARVLGPYFGGEELARQVRYVVGGG